MEAYFLGFCADNLVQNTGLRTTRKKNVHLRVGVSHIGRKTISACLFIYFSKCIGSLGTIISFLKLHSSSLRVVSDVLRLWIHKQLAVFPFC